MNGSNPAPALNSAPPSGSHTQFLKRKRILLVESDGFTRMVLMLLFRSVGFKVDFTANGSIAWRKFRNQVPDALVMDLKLSGLSGLQLIKAVRGEAEFKGRPIYVFTHVEMIKKAMRKEVLMHVTKLFDKRSISRESLVRSIIGDFTEAEATKQLEAKAVQTAEPEPEVETPEEVLLPGEIDEIIDGVCAQSELIAQSKGSKEQIDGCRELLSRVRSLGSCVEAGGLANVARQTRALERLLNELCQKPQGFTDNVLGTIAQGVEVLGRLAKSEEGTKQPRANFTAIIVDESHSSGACIQEGLREAGFIPVIFDNPAQGLEHLAAKPVDLVVTNLYLPELHGFHLANIRQIPLQAATPVIFVSDLLAVNHPKEGRLALAPSVDKNPLLVHELVMKALNEVQGKGAPAESASLGSPPAISAAETAKLDTEVSTPATSGSELLSSRLTPQVRETLALSSADLATPRPTEINEAAPSQELSSAQVADLRAEKATVSSHAKKVIFFVEDDPFALKVYKKGLKRAGFHVEVAENGLEAISVLPTIRPDVVVLDLMLPELPGTEVLRFIRGDADLRNTPVIVLSNAYIDEIAAEAIQAGASRGLLKSECTPAKLVEQVCDVLGRPGSTIPLESILEEPEAVTLSSDVNLEAETAMWTRQAGLRKAAPKEVAKIRQVCLNYIKATDDKKSLPQLMDLYRRVRFLSAHAALIGFTKIAEVSSALEGLLFEIVCKQAQPTSTTYQTLAQVVDLLDQLIQKDDTTFAEPRTKPKVLVVEDDKVQEDALAAALRRGNFEVQTSPDPLQSLELLSADQFDAVLLKVDMPQMSGFEVCRQLRLMPRNKSVPVLFATGNAGFEQRARSVISGGNDLIAKPVSPLELILKVTTHLLKQNGHKPSDRTRANSAEGTIEPGATESVELSSMIEREMAPTTEQITALPSGAPDPMARGMTPAMPSSDNSQTAEASEAAAEDRMEAATLSASAAAERQTDEDKVEKPLIRMCDSGGPDSLASEPVKAVGIDESDGTVQSNGITAEASLPQGEARNGTKEYESTPAPESSAAARPDRRNKKVEVLQACLDETKSQLASAEMSRRLQEMEKALAERATELQRAKNELEQQAKEHGIVESDLREQLAAANAVGKQNSEANEQTQTRVSQLEQELAALRKTGEELNNKVVQEHQAGAKLGKRIGELEEQLRLSAEELEKGRSALEKEAKEHEFIETDLQEQLATANQARTQRAEAHEQAQTRVAQLEQELVALRQAGEELNCKVAKEQEAGAESSKRIGALEEQLRQREEELEKTRGALEKEAKEHEFIETDLQEQLAASNGVRKQRAEAHKQAESRVAQLEKELVALRRTGEELNCKVAKEQEAGAESSKRIGALEEQLRQRGEELEKAQGALGKEAKEHEFIETDLREQLAVESEAKNQSVSAREQAQSRVTQLEQELVALRQTGEELNCKVAKEKQTGAKSSKRIGELEEQLRQREEDLEKAKGALEKAAKEHEFIEADLQQQLAAAGEAGKHRAEAHEQARTQVAQLEQELTTLRQSGKELTQKVASEQQASAEFGRRIEQLEENLRQRGVELERALGDSDTQRKERERVETDLRSQLAAAGDTSKQSTAAHHQAVARVAQLEQELDSLRMAGEELNGKVAQEQQAGADARKQIGELEEQLRQRAAQLEMARLELEKRAKSRNRVEGDLRRKLKIASDVGKQREAACHQAQSRVAHLEQELVGLRQTGEELSCKVAEEQQAAAGSNKRIGELEQQLRERAVELEKVKGNLEQQAEAYAVVEGDLRRQLQAANEAGVQRDSAHESRMAQLQQELAAVRQAGEELNRKVAYEQHAGAESNNRVKELEEQLRQRAMEWEQAKGDWEQQARNLGQTETDLRRQLAEAAEAGKQSAAAHQHAQSCAARLGQELVTLKQAREELNRQVAAEQQAGVESGRRISELEYHLGQRTTELELARNDLRLQALEQERVGMDLRRQSAAADEAAQRSVAAQQQAQFQVSHLEQELTGLRQAIEDYRTKLAKEQQAAAELRGSNKDLERQLHSTMAVTQAQTAELEQRITQSVTALARVTADLAKATGERQRSDERAAVLNVRLQELHAESTRLLQAQHADRERISDLESQLHQREETVTRQNTEVEQLRAECQHTEEELFKAKDLNAHLRKDVTFFEEAHQALNSAQQDLQSRLAVALDEARASGSSLQREVAERQQLAVNLDNAQRELQTQGRMREALEGRLQKTFQALCEGETKLQQETAERQRLAVALDATLRDLRQQTQKREAVEVELHNTVQALCDAESRATQECAERCRLNQALEAAQLNLHDQLQRAALELTKCQSALQFEHVERKRREAQMARMRHLSLELARGARSLKTTLRRQTREPLENLYQSARILLQLELEQEPMKVAEAILKDVLLVQARLQEMEAHHDSTEAGTNGSNGSCKEVPAEMDAVG